MDIEIEGEELVPERVVVGDGFHPDEPLEQLVRLDLFQRLRTDHSTHPGSIAVLVSETPVSPALSLPTLPAGSWKAERHKSLVGIPSAPFKQANLSELIASRVKRMDSRASQPRDDESYLVPMAHSSLFAPSIERLAKAYHENEEAVGALEVGQWF